MERLTVAVNARPTIGICWRYQQKFKLMEVVRKVGNICYIIIEYMKRIRDIIDKQFINEISCPLMAGASISIACFLKPESALYIIGFQAFMVSLVYVLNAFDRAAYRNPRISQEVKC
jgi:hypothetical protein